MRKFRELGVSRMGITAHQTTSASRLPLLVLVVAGLVSWVCSAARAQRFPPPPDRPGSSFERITPYVPTPRDVAEKMLEFAQVDKYDRVYDLGSGDGRIVILAAQKFGAEAVGIELEGKLVEQSSAQIAALGLAQRAQIIRGDIFQSDFHRATVVTLYLLTRVNERLRPLLEKQLRPGARVVCNSYQVPGWKPDKVQNLVSQNGAPYTLYLYIRP
jgi:SAM-dependent methyltransferase